MHITPHRLYFRGNNNVELIFVSYHGFSNMHWFCKLIIIMFEKNKIKILSPLKVDNTLT
jgi:hypothetical protein